MLSADLDGPLVLAITTGDEGMETTIQSLGRNAGVSDADAIADDQAVGQCGGCWVCNSGLAAP